MTNTYSDVAVEALAERFRELQAENERYGRALKTISQLVDVDCDEAPIIARAALEPDND